MFKPMEAATLVALEDAKFPCYVQPKLDGIRCLIVDGVAVSKTLKPIPNLYIQEKLKGLPNGVDGELLLIDDQDFNAVQSAVMSIEGEPNFEYSIFDFVAPKPFSIRTEHLTHFIENESENIFIAGVETTQVDSLDKLKELEEAYLEHGCEGVMLRSPNNEYKHGRSTLNEFSLVKYKRFKDSEGYVIGFVEQEHNDNPATIDALGHTVRSTSKIGIRQANKLGTLVLHDETLGVEVEVGTGFTDEQRIDIWNNQRKYMGETVTYKYQDLTKKGQPRFPSFKGFRLDN